MKLSLLLIGLLLAGCSQEPLRLHEEFVLVRKHVSDEKIREICAKDVSEGDVMICFLDGEPCIRSKCKAATVLLAPEYLSVREFMFRYENDPDFKKSIQSYEFRQF